tara:strand:+ start:3245 stop:3874 length:630 start_codon:yes stop_codon:yes gene_type:complete
MVLVGAPPEAAAALASALGETGVAETNDFVSGLYFATNPNGAGEYRMPDDLKATVCVMGTEGLRRTDPAYLDRVVLIVDHWSRTDADEWLLVVHDLLVDASTRGLPLWTMSAAQPVWTGFARWASRGGVPLAKAPPLLPRPAANSSPNALCERLHSALATRGNIGDELAQALGDHVESRRERVPSSTTVDETRVQCSTGSGSSSKNEAR